MGGRSKSQTVGYRYHIGMHLVLCQGPVDPVTALAQPERLAVGDYAYLVDALGAIREAVAILAFDATAGTVDLARGVLDTTPQAHPAGTRLVGVGEWLAAETIERAPGESVFVAAIPRTASAEGDAVLAANGAPLVLAGRQARPYPPGRVRFNGQREPAVVAGDLILTWAHRDRTLQTAYLVKQDEGDIGPEPGTTYTVRIRDRHGVLVRTQSGLTGNGWTWDVASSAIDAGPAGDRITVEIEAERDGLSCWQALGAILGWGVTEPIIDMSERPRIDVHLLTLDEPAEWRAACIANLEGAPVRLRVLPGIPGRIGEARAAGYAQGPLPLASFVDPDDLYEASAFAQLADALESHPQAVLAYTDEALMDEAGRPLGLRRLAYSAFQHAHSASHVHGLIVMRRAAVEAVLAATTDIHPLADWLLTRLVAQRDAVLHLPLVGRHWRQHPRQVHRAADPDVVRRIRQTIDQATNPRR